MSGQEIEWPRLIGDASALGATRMLLLGVTLAHGLLDAPVPADILWFRTGTRAA